MQIIYKCNCCGGDNLDEVSTNFTEKIKIIQGEEYDFKKCSVLFICNDCGEIGEDEFIYLEKKGY